MRNNSDIQIKKEQKVNIEAPDLNRSLAPAWSLAVLRLHSSGQKVQKIFRPLFLAIPVFRAD
jgi:hypothetical protein